MIATANRAATAAGGARNVPRSRPRRRPRAFPQSQRRDTPLGRLREAVPCMSRGAYQLALCKSMPRGASHICKAAPETRWLTTRLANLYGGDGRRSWTSVQSACRRSIPGAIIDMQPTRCPAFPSHAQRRRALARCDRRSRTGMTTRHGARARAFSWRSMSDSLPPSRPASAPPDRPPRAKAAGASLRATPSRSWWWAHLGDRGASRHLSAQAVSHRSKRSPRPSSG